MDDSEVVLSCLSFPSYERMMGYKEFKVPDESEP